MRRLLALSLMATACAVALPAVTASAGAPPIDSLDVDLVSATEPLTFSAFVDDEITCDSIAVLEVLANGEAVEPLAVVPDDEESNLVYIVLPSATPAGELEVAVECVDGEVALDYEGDRSWAALAVTKAVDGPAPEGAEFVVDVECLATMSGTAFVTPQGLGGDETYSLTYTAAGGTKYVYFESGAECTITEPVNGGAIATTIAPELVEINDPGDFTSTVVNTFAAAVEPTFTG